MLINQVALRISRDVSTNSRVTSYCISYIDENAHRIMYENLRSVISKKTNVEGNIILKYMLRK